MVLKAAPQLASLPSPIVHSSWSVTESKQTWCQPGAHCVLCCPSKVSLVMTMTGSATNAVCVPLCAYPGVCMSTAAATFGALTLVSLWPKTGRTHQLRKHMAYIGKTGRIASRCT